MVGCGAAAAHPGRRALGVLYAAGHAPPTGQGSAQARELTPALLRLAFPLAVSAYARKRAEHLSAAAGAQGTAALRMDGEAALAGYGLNQTAWL